MNELLGRQAPHSAPAEQAVVGSMLIDPRCIPEVIDKLKSEDFFIEANREVFDTMFAMFAYGQTVDPVTVLDQMKVRGVYHEESTQRYVMELMQVTPTAANVLEYAAIVRDRALMRALADTAEEIGAMVYEGAGSADAMLEVAERKVYALRKDRHSGGLMPVSAILQNVYDKISAAAESDADVPGMSTGLSDLDRAILGLGPGDLVFIASRPGMGKTSFALDMALSAGKNKKTVAIFSLEMTREQLVTRLLSNCSGVDSKKLQTGRLLNAKDWKDITDAASEMSLMDIRIDDNPTLSVADMNAQCRRLQKLDLVIVDYLQLMQSAGSGSSWSNESRTQAVSDMSRMLKIMAKELGVPVICLSQLSRANEKRENKRPILADMRESGSIEQDADVVLGLYREGYYDQECEDPYEAECIILKNRRGETKTVKLRWVPDRTTFAAVDTAHG